jgi:hypothetical protein
MKISICLVGVVIEDVYILCFNGSNKLPKTRK